MELTSANHVQHGPNSTEIATEFGFEVFAYPADWSRAASPSRPESTSLD
jgi:hypothetical protein